MVRTGADATAEHLTLSPDLLDQAGPADHARQAQQIQQAWHTSPAQQAWQTDPAQQTYPEPREPSWSADEVLLSLVPDPGREAAALAAAGLGDVASSDEGASTIAGDGRQEWPPPRLVDETAPGALLASLAAEVDLATCSDDMVVGLAAAAARLQSWAAALEVDATVALVQRAGQWRGVTPAGQPRRKESAVQAERIAAAELGAALGLSPGSALRRVSQATELQRVPQTRLALARGDLDLAKARMVLELLRPLDDEAAARVDAAVVAGAAGRTYRQLRDSLRRAVLAVDPDAARKRARQVEQDRSVERFDTSNGAGGITWLDDPVAIERFYTWLTATAEAARGPGDTRTLDQLRADVLADLGRRGLEQDTTHPDLPTDPSDPEPSDPEPSDPEPAPAPPRRGRGAPRRLPTRQGRRPQIQVVVSVETLLGLDEMPGELVGYGPITADTARRIAGEGTWRRLLTDPRTGRFDELSVDTHDPPQDLLDHVLARDRYCRRGLGCRMPANRCDVDHRVNYPRGPTAAGNLDAGCRPDHDIKTFTDTTVRRDRDGEPGDLRITYPSGRSYRLPVEPVLEPIDLDTPPF